MTKYPIWDELKNKKYCYRRLHTEQSIRSYLESTKFQICYIKSYFEILSKDYSRKNMNVKPSKVIEVLSLKQEIKVQNKTLNFKIDLEMNNDIIKIERM